MRNTLLWVESKSFMGDLMLILQKGFHHIMYVWLACSVLEALGLDHVTTTQDTDLSPASIHWNTSITTFNLCGKYYIELSMPPHMKVVHAPICPQVLNNKLLYIRWLLSICTYSSSQQGSMHSTASVCLITR